MYAVYTAAPFGAAFLRTPLAQGGSFRILLLAKERGNDAIFTGN